ncbi:hypothetical protein ACFE04_030815 [Oxalis oulophora]
MVADISSLFGFQQQQQQPQQMNNGNSEILMTRDLLGNLSNDNHMAGRNKYQDKYNSTNSTTSRICSTPTRNFMFNDQEETCLDLKLESFSSSTTTTTTTTNPNYYQSVCTLDKVRSALQRAEKEVVMVKNKRTSLSPPHQLSTGSGSGSGMFAAGCPGCLLYVMIENSNPKCPRCNTIVTSPNIGKKPRIDLNASS